MTVAGTIAGVEALAERDVVTDGVAAFLPMGEGSLISAGEHDAREPSLAIDLEAATAAVQAAEVTTPPTADPLFDPALEKELFGKGAELLRSFLGTDARTGRSRSTDARATDAQATDGSATNGSVTNGSVHDGPSADGADDRAPRPSDVPTAR